MIPKTRIGIAYLDYEEYTKSLKEIGVDPDVVRLVRDISPMKGYTGLNFNIKVHINNNP